MARRGRCCCGGVLKFFAWMLKPREGEREGGRKLAVWRRKERRERAGKKKKKKDTGGQVGEEKEERKG